MSEFTSTDAAMMSRALQLAELGMNSTDPNPRVGCVLAEGERIIAEGWHEVAGGPHAEIVALDKAGEAAQGTTAYVTLEPCCHHGKTPPCSDALIKAGVARVVVAMEDPNPEVAGKGLQQLRDAGIEVDTGLLQSQAEALNPGFITRMRQQKPYVRSKLAMSLDGRTAMASGESQWITGPAARQDVQRLRSRSSAIVTGIGTILADNPSLTARDVDDNPMPRQPLRVVLDPHLTTPVDAKLFSHPGKILIVTAVDTPWIREQLEQAGAEVICLPNAVETVDLHRLMLELAERGINEVMLETGAVLSGSALRAGIIDELVIYMAPKLMGDEARGLFHTPGLESLSDAVNLSIKDVRAVGDDWRITATVIYED